MFSDVLGWWESTQAPTSGIEEEPQPCSGKGIKFRKFLVICRSKTGFGIPLSPGLDWPTHHSIWKLERHTVFCSA